MPYFTVTLTNGDTIIVGDDLEHVSIGPMLAQEGYWTTNRVGRDKETKITLMLRGVATIEPNFNPHTELADHILGEDY